MPKLTDIKKKENKELILDASFRCFSRKGYHKTSMRDIAQEAKLSLGAIYVYFETKDEIVKALVGRSIKERQRFLEETGEGGIRSFLLKLAKEMNKPKGMQGFRADIGIWAALLDDRELQSVAQDAIEEFLEDVAALLEREQQDRTSDPENTARVILAIIQGGAVQKIINPELDMTNYYETALTLIKY